MPPYIAPGAAFSNGFEGYLADQQAQQRQAMMDQIAMQREKRLADYQQAELEQSKDALSRQRSEADQRNFDRRKSDVEKTVGNMIMGDTPDAAFLKEVDAVGMGHMFPPDPATGHRVFMGSSKERLEKKTQDEALKFAGTLPEGSPERQAMEFTARFPGRTPPAGMFRGAAETDTTPIVRVSPGNKGVVQRLVNGQWVDQTGDVPKGSHFLQETPPKDTSARDAVNADRDARRVDTTREHAYTELDTIAKELRPSLDKYDKLGTLLNQKNAQADALVAPLILGAVVGGQGSGFRMTRAEIDKVLTGRTKWEDLDATLAKWSADPQHFQIPDSQREAMKALAKAVREKAYRVYHTVINGREEIDSAKDVDSINRTRTKVQKDLFPDEPVDETGTNPSSDSTSPSGLPSVGSTWNGGKVLAVRKK